MFTPSTPWKLHWVVPLALTLILLALQTLSYPAFHLLVELFTIIIAVNTFVVAWNTFPFSRNGYLLFVGLGFFWIAAIDLAHTLTYKGMNVLPVLTTNPPTQLWIAARYCEALLLLVAPIFLQRSFLRGPTFALFGVIAATLIFMVPAGYFPDCYVDYTGLTRFKIVSEYVIAGLFFLALLHVQSKRALLDHRLLVLISLSLAIKVFAELAFTRYHDVYGVANLTGHLLKLLSFWLIYVALVEWSLTRPFISLARGANTFDAVPDPTAVVDQQGFVRQLNNAARAHAGLPGDSALGSHVHDLFHSKSVTRENCPVCRAILAGEPLQQSELERPEIGRWFEVTLSPILRSGAYSGSIQVLHDVTRTKDALLDLEYTLKRLRETQNQIIQSEKLSALGTLTAGIAHELNNPLMGIHNYVEFAEVNSEGRTKEMLGRAKRELKRVQEMLGNMLAYARPARSANSTIDARLALDLALQLVAADLRKEGIEVRIELPQTLPSVCAVLDGLQQIFINLILNARDAMANSAKKILAFRATETPEWIYITVADTGIGMDEFIRHRIFDPFFTTKPTGSGTGLGLPVSLNIVTGFGGTITCESHPGAGSEFTVKLRRCT